MKLKVYDTSAKEKLVVRLQLIEDSEGILVVAVDCNGDRISMANLLRFDNGKILRCYAVNPHLGFDLDNGGRIQFDDE